MKEKLLAIIGKIDIIINTPQGDIANDLFDLQTDIQNIIDELD